MLANSLFIGKKVAYQTLGCKLNFAETSQIGKQLAELGFTVAKPCEVADVCVINTCSVTEVADRKDRQCIKQMIKKHPGAFVIVVGCYAQLKPQDVSAIEGVDLVLGTQHKFDVAEQLYRFFEHRDGTGVLRTERCEIDAFTPFCTRGDRTRYFLKVQDGCDYFCTYCTIPIARGRSRNGSVADTVAQAEMAVAEGAKEIVLAGVNIGDFGKSTGETFFDLVKALDSVDGIERYRISSIEPNLLTDEIIEFTSNSEKFAPHFHIPLQSGSDNVLALMKRRYTRSLFAEKVSKIKSVMPDAFIGVDVIVGTNGETDEFFSDALSFLKSLDVSQLHVFSYSERAGTYALKISGKVSAAKKKERSELLHTLSEQKRLSFYESQIGSIHKVLWEDARKQGKMHGFTENYVRVEMPYSEKLVNSISKVKLLGFADGNESLVCEIVE